jgi:hypothetical protein
VLSRKVNQVKKKKKDKKEENLFEIAARRLTAPRAFEKVVKTGPYSILHSK